MPDEIARVIIEYESKLDQAQKDLDALNVKLDKAGAKVDEFASKLASMKGDVPPGLGVELDSLTAKYNALTTAVASNRAMLDKYQSGGTEGVSPKSASSRVNNLQSAIAIREKEFEDLRLQANQLSPKIYEEQMRQYNEAIAPKVAPIVPVSAEADAATIRATQSQQQFGNASAKSAQQIQEEADALQEYNRQILAGLGGNGDVRTNVSVNKEGLQRVTESVKTEGERGPVTTTTEIENEAQAFSKGAQEANQYQRALSQMSSAQFEASLKGKPLEEQLALTQQRLQTTGQATKEYYQLQGRQAGLETRVQVGQQRAEAQDFEDAARGANKYETAVGRLSEAQFKASLQGKSLEEQLSLVNTRLQQVGQATPEQYQLQGRAAGLETRIQDTQQRDEARQFEEYATAATAAERAQRSFSEAQFQGSLKGKSLEEQLALVQGRLGSVGQATNEYNRLIGQQATLQDKIANQPLAGTLEALQNRASEAKKGFILGDPKSTKELSEATKELDAAMKGANDTMGKSKSFAEKLGETFDRQVIRIGIGIAVWSTLRMAQQEIQATEKAMEDYSLEVARFEAITDQSIGEAVQQYNALRDAATQRGFTPTEAAPAILAASRYQKNPAEQADLVGAAAQLSEAMGLKDATQATDALGAAQKATGRSAKELANIVYSAYKEMGGDPQQFMNALVSAQTISDETGGDFIKMFTSITKGAEESKRSMDTVAQVAGKFSENISNLSGDKVMEFATQLQDLAKVNPLNADYTLKSVDEILSEIHAKWASYAPELQSQIMDVLSGGKMKEQMKQAGAGFMDNFGEGLSSEAPGALDKATGTIESALGSMTKRIDAYKAIAEQGGNAIGAGFTSIFKTIGLQADIITGGTGGGQNAEGVAQLSSGQGAQQGADMRLNFLKSLYGMTPDEAATAIKDWNQKVNASADAERASLGLWVLDPFKIGAVMRARDSALVSQEQTTEALKDLAESGGEQVGKAYISGFSGVLQSSKASQQDLLLSRMKQDWATQKTGAGKQSQGADISTPRGYVAGELSTYAKDIAGGNPNAQSPFPTSELDLSKDTQEQINAAKAKAVLWGQEEVKAQYDFTLALTGSATEAKKVADALQDQIDKTLTLVRTQNGVTVEMGAQGKYLQEALDKEKSDFQFQRHENIPSSDASKLEALANMYDKFLAKIGSPEKKQNVNLLLGEDNVFKHMNVTMTGLGLAIEDLTKVEKAQLSGTWNLPAGSTALVPISSLDIQRWNKTGGSGLTPEQIAALMGATSQSGEKVSTAVGRSAQDIIAAILSGKTSMASGMREANSNGYNLHDFSLSLAEAIRNAALQSIATGRDKLTPEPWRKEPTLTPAGIESAPWWQNLIKLSQSPPAPQSPLGPDRSYDAIENIRSNRNTPLSGMGQKAMYSPPVNVNVSMLPVKANFNANLSVILNGQVLARTLAPILYDMLIRTARSTGITPKGAQRS